MLQHTVLLWNGIPHCLALCDCIWARLDDSQCSADRIAFGRQFTYPCLAYAYMYTLIDVSHIVEALSNSTQCIAQPGQGGQQYVVAFSPTNTAATGPA